MTAAPIPAEREPSATHRFNNDLRYRDGEHPQQTHLTPPYVLEPVREALGGVDPALGEDRNTHLIIWEDDGLFTGRPVEWVPGESLR